MSEIVDKLNNLQFIQKLDSKNCLSSLNLIPQQIETTWKQVWQMEMPYSQNDISNIIFCGMGGSAYGARIIKSLFQSSLNLPITIIDDYDLPKFVDKNSLIICSSYSGNTEETISCAMQAISRKFKLFGITSGGQLAQLLQGANFPVYLFSDSLNPSHQPRLGLGIMITSPLAILAKLNLIDVDSITINKIVQLLQQNTPLLSPNKSASYNLAKQFAVNISKKIINFIAADFLQGAIHVVRNPINETGKHFANYFILPEANHHLLEGLKFPDNLKNSSVFVFIDSNLYPTKIKQRMALTKDVVAKNGRQILTINLSWGKQLEQNFELIQLGGYISFYLAIIHGVDPAPVPWVDYFKDKMSAKGGSASG